MAHDATGSREPNLQYWTERLGERDANKRLHAVTVLASYGPRARAAVPALIAVLRDRLPEIRRRATIALAEIGPEARQAVPALIQVLQDEEEAVRCRAVMALGDLGAEARSAVPALIGLLQDESDLVRRWAAAALGEIGPTAPAAIPALIEALADDDIKNRAVTAAALAKMGSRAVPRLIEALHHPSANVRRHASLLLAKCSRGEDALPALHHCLADPDPFVSEAAAEALQKIAPTTASGRRSGRSRVMRRASE